MPAQLADEQRPGGIRQYQRLGDPARRPQRGRAVNSAAPQLISISRPSGSAVASCRAGSAYRHSPSGVMLNHQGWVLCTDGAHTASATRPTTPAVACSDMVGVAGAPRVSTGASVLTVINQVDFHAQSVLTPGYSRESPHQPRTSVRNHRSPFLTLVHADLGRSAMAERGQLARLRVALERRNGATPT